MQSFYVSGGGHNDVIEATLERYDLRMGVWDISDEAVDRRGGAGVGWEAVRELALNVGLRRMSHGMVFIR